MSSTLSAEGMKGKTTASEVLRHPIRVRILEALNTRDRVSPVGFLRAGLAWDLPGLKGKSIQAQMSHVSYHFRELAKAGCIEVVDTRAVRGSQEHFYRASARAYFTDAEWAALSISERREISKTMFRGFIAQGEGALLSDTFDSRPDRWLAWMPFAVDEQGWDELTAAIGTCWAEVEQIRHDARRRLDTDGDTAGIPATFGIFGFESPLLGDALPMDEGDPEEPEEERADG
jgi:hypothetical protein